MEQPHDAPASKTAVVAASRFDAIVVGGGPVGLAAALALAGAGLATALVAPPAPPADGRTVALLDGSVRFLDGLGAWHRIADAAAPLATLRIIDDTGSLFRPPPVSFGSAEIGLDAFGWNVEVSRLVASLRESAEAAPGLTLVEGSAVDLVRAGDATEIVLDEGRRLAAGLAVAADGARSRLREAAGIATRAWDYPQSALTTLLAHERPHADASTEFHTRDGPFTLVPLAGGRRSSLVWVARADEAERLAALDDAALARAIEARCRSMLGVMRVDGPRGVVPMRGATAARLTAPGLALVGEAAHVFPPIGAQGLNLGLRDAAALAESVAEAGRRGQAPGGPESLAGYERARRLDVRARSAAVDLLNRSLLTQFLPVDLARGAGLLALGALGPLRRAVMRAGVLPRSAPRAMRDAG